MKKLVSSMVLLFLFSFGIHAQHNAQLRFDEANTLLENSKYLDAMNTYRQIAAGNQVSGALFLNMGIASIQLDSLGLAKYYLLKASQFETTKTSATEALEYVESQFSRQSATLPKLPWDKAVDWMKDVPTSGGVFFIGFACILISVSLILMHWFNLFSLKQIGTTVSSFALSSILIVVLAFYVDYVDHRYSEAVIITNEIQVKQKAEDAGDLVSLGYEGYSITIDHKKSDKVAGWLYIRLGNGQFGWIKKGGVKIL